MLVLKRWCRHTLLGIGTIVQHLLWLSIVIGGMHFLSFLAQEIMLFGIIPVKYVIQAVDLAVISLFLVIMLLELWEIARGANE